MAFIFRLLISGLLLLAAAAADAVPAPTPASGAITPLRQQLQTEQARLEKLQALAHSSHPELKKVEVLAAAAKAQMTKKQEEARQAIDKYLKDNNLTAKDLAAFKLDAITDLLLRIMPHYVVNEPKLQPLLAETIRTGPPVAPGEFARRFPGKKPADVPAAELMEFYKTSLKAEALKTREKLLPLLKEAKTPEFMVIALQDITRLRCILSICRQYLDARTPAELKEQRRRVQLIQRRLEGK